MDDEQLSSVAEAAGRGTVVLFKSPSEPLEDDLYFQEGRKRGYDVRFVPVLAFRTGRDGKEKLREALQAAERFSGLVVTSQQGVHVRVTRHPRSSNEDDDLRAWVDEKKKLFCVGPQTADKLSATFLRSAGCDSERLPAISTAENGQQLAAVIVREMEALGHDRPPLLYLCGNIRRSELPAALKEAGITLDELEVYETVTSPSLPPDMAFSGGKPRGAQQQPQRVDWMCFFSPSGVKAIHEELNKRGAEEEEVEEEENGGDGAPRMAAIGPTTAKALTDIFGAPPTATASSPCALGLFDAIEQCASSSSSSSMPPSEHEP